MSFYVYIISNEKNTPLFDEVINDLDRRIYEHKNKLISKSFLRKYNLYKLPYWKTTENVVSAIEREKQLKKWHKIWKLNFIKSMNPKYKDFSIYPNFLDPETSSGRHHSV